MHGEEKYDESFRFVAFASARKQLVSCDFARKKPPSDTTSSQEERLSV